MVALLLKKKSVSEFSPVMKHGNNSIKEYTANRGGARYFHWGQLTTRILSISNSSK
uniref:Uncharacterized protein n=1 Tax=Arundo donax TaxID=35708 RepID=A0A0A9B7P1_ARUDO